LAIFVLQRLMQTAVTLWALSLLLFLAIYAIGDPVAILIDPDAGPEEIAVATRALGLDLPLWRQYLVFLGNIATGSTGTSFLYNQPAMDLVAQRLPATLELALVAFAFTVVIAIPAGLWAGLRPNSWSGQAIMTGSIVAISLPTFWFGLLLVLVFSVGLGWLPSGGRGPTAPVFGVELSVATLDGWRHLLLPALTMAIYNVALVARVVRAGVREALDQDFMRFAEAKGLSRRRIVFVHLLRSILVPIITVLGIELGQLIALTIVIEMIFSWPGLGRLLIESVYRLDRPMVIAVLMTTVGLVIVINFVVDLLYGVLDPRIRLGGSS
jgi:peptide/nickel transport system permease protein